MPPKIISPITSSMPRGQAKCCCVASAGAGCASSIRRAASMTTTAVKPPIAASCTRGSIATRRSAPVSAAPAIAPTLNIACRLLITARPDTTSRAVPSVLTATSNRLIAMPNSSIAGSSSHRVPQTSASASIAPITAAASAQALRAPMWPISVPATEQRNHRADAGGEQHGGQHRLAERVLRLDRRDVHAPGAAQQAQRRELDARGPHGA